MSVSPWLTYHATKVVPTLKEALVLVKDFAKYPVYLGGPIHGLSDAECSEWRNAATAALPGRTIDPILWDFRGKEDAHVCDIVERDLAAIRTAGMLLVNGEKPGWGTAMEIRFAWGLKKPIIVFIKNNL